LTLAESWPRPVVIFVYEKYEHTLSSWAKEDHTQLKKKKKKKKKKLKLKPLLIYFWKKKNKR
jgi:hypothetical protein